jgi:hypothetical protein
MSTKAAYLSECTFQMRSEYTRADQRSRRYTILALRPSLNHFAFAVSDTQRGKSFHRRFETRNKSQFTAAKRLERVSIVPITT